MIITAESISSASRFHQIGASIPGAIPPPLRMLSTGPGCCVRNHSIDFHTITMSAQAKMDNTAQSRARVVGSSIARRSIRYPTYSSQHTKYEVSRASQVHQMPQAMRPHRLPVISVMVANASDTSLMDAAMASKRKFLLARYATLANIAKKKPVNEVIADGTWK